MNATEKTRTILFYHKGAIDLQLTQASIFQALRELGEVFVFKNNPLYPSRKNWSLGIKNPDGTWSQMSNSELHPYLNEHEISIQNDSGKGPVPYALPNREVSSLLACCRPPDDLPEIKIQDLYEARGKLWGIPKRLF